MSSASTAIDRRRRWIYSPQPSWHLYFVLAVLPRSSSPTPCSSSHHHHVRATGTAHDVSNSASHGWQITARRQIENPFPLVASPLPSTCTPSAAHTPVAASGFLLGRVERVDDEGGGTERDPTSSDLLAKRNLPADYRSENMLWRGRLGKWRMVESLQGCEGQRGRC